jgi:hypothetical protein
MVKEKKLMSKINVKHMMAKGLFEKEKLFKFILIKVIYKKQ